MQGGHVIQEPVNLSSVLTSSKPNYITSLTKIVGTLGPKSCSVEIIEACLKAGMSVARFDFSWLDGEYHQKTLDNLRMAVKKSGKLCAVMLDTMGPQLHVSNNTGNPIELRAEQRLIITPDMTKQPSSQVLPVKYDGLAKAVKKGDTIFLGQYLFTGSEKTSVWLEVVETGGADVICLVKNSAVLSGFIITIHVSQVRINLPTLSDTDKQVICDWGARNSVSFISLSHTRHGEDVQELRAFLKANKLEDIQIFAKIENVEGLKHFDNILNEADGIILGRGNLGIDLPPEKVFLFQKSAIHKCNMIGKPIMVSRVMDSMTENLRPTRAEATDIANAVLDGTDGILLGAETFRGQYPVEAIETVGKICAEAEKVYNQPSHYKRLVSSILESMTHAEAVASSAVRVAAKVKAAMLIVFTSSGRAARLIAKYRPVLPVFAVVIPRLSANSIKWTFNGTLQARQLLGVRGVYPILASPYGGTTGGYSEEFGLKVTLEHANSVGLLKQNDKVVIFQKIRDSFVVKVHEYV
uniref:Pyruvate kinase n=2 Tax=Kalanchoe fedtschenkoi TaxID=63787 RepID=A0A7N0TUK2_KALFE